MIECVPNLSEGCDAEVVAAIAAAARPCGARILDIHSDCDHHRSVLTLVGTAGQLESAAVAVASRAAETIDLRRHRGVHPRIGALDVVPFAPLAGATMEDCVAAAERVGEEIAREIGVPVFLYGRAARVPERASLADLRRGGLAALEARIGRGTWAPDFGPRRLHPSAGAVAVGARPLLVAYNILLGTSDLAQGREIAAATRAAGGGPPGVQALAFFLPSRGRVQISMNLADVAATSLADAFSRVANLAAARGIDVISSEIVGLAPRRAAAGASAASLRLADNLCDHILEDRLEER